MARTATLEQAFDLQKVVDKVQGAYAECGYLFDKPVEPYVDSGLQIMGYSGQQGEKSYIVVSGFAMQSGMLPGLVAHELGHVFRTEQGHSSHEPMLLSELMEERAFNPQVLRNALNHVQDIYADDVAFPVLDKIGFKEKELQGFFLNWMNTSVGSRMQNAAIAASNAFATANLERHEMMEGIREKVEMKNASFLRQSHMEKPFQYFRTFMLTLPEEASREKMRAMLGGYLDELMKAAK